MPALEAVLDLAVRAGGDAARAAAVLNIAEAVLAGAEARVLALSPAERTAAAEGEGRVTAPAAAAA
jgi:hypothetical protein